MKFLGLAGLVVFLLVGASQASAHPVPFTYLDVRVEGLVLDVALVAHVIDVGHDLKIDPAERLFDPAVLQANRAAIAQLLGEQETQPLAISRVNRRKSASTIGSLRPS